MNLKDQVAIVTGGGGGLGEGICICLARAGADVVVSDVNKDLAQKVAASVKELGRKAIAVSTDVRDEAACRRLVDRTLEEMGRLDILVCSAGTAATHLMSTGEEAADVENISTDVWDLTMDVNLKGVFLCNRAVIPHFKKQQSGKIINISSGAGRGGGAMLPVYSASKAGVINLSQSIALQLAPYGVNVNTVCPGIIWTPMWAEGMELMVKSRPELKDVSPEDAFQFMIETSIPLKRRQTPEDIGNMVAFLASEQAQEITGQAINVDGGLRLN